MTRQTKTFLTVLLLFAGLFRFGFGAFVVGFGAAPKGDEVDYHILAEHVAAGEGYTLDDGRPTGRRPPAYPLFLAVLYKFFGPHQALARVVQALLGMVVVALAFFVARKYFGEHVGMVAGVVTALNPFLIFVSAYILTENLYVVLLLVALLVIPTATSVTGTIKAALIGTAILAVAALSRPTALPLGMWMLAATVLFGGGTLLLRMRRGAVLAALFFLILLPWSVRNYYRLGGWALITTHGGITFYQGNNQRVIDVPHYRGGVAPLGALPLHEELSSLTEYEADRVAWKAGRQFLREHWTQIPGITWWKFARFWRLRSEMGLSGIKSGWWWSRDSFLGRIASDFDVGLIYAVIAMPLFVVGLLLTWRRRRDLLFLYGIVVMHTLIALIFFGSLRARVPVEPVIAIFAAVTIARLAEAWTARRRGRARI